MSMSARLLKFFEYEHLPDPLRTVSRQFFNLAIGLDHLVEDGPEKMVALRKLLESKDCAVRARLEEMRKESGE